jgi:endogenous inhibitor of DNA gyrase (YacG/DUF329 family)
VSAFNTVHLSLACAKCGADAVTEVQFKYGSTWQHRYALGDALRWGGNDIGRPGEGRVVVDGIATSRCPACGLEVERDVYVFVEHGRIASVEPADRTHDFAGSGRTYIELPSSDESSRSPDPRRRRG